jgi:phosphonatase-like hydrolase
MTMIQLAVFDMAGTTVLDHDNVHQALMNAMASFGFQVERPEANALMGYPKPLAIREMLERREADLALVEPIHRAFLDEMIHFYQTDPGVAPTVYAEETFEILREKGIKVALDTGFSRDITEAIIERLNWHDRIDAWVASDMVERGRPYPDMIRYLMDKTGVSAPEAVAKIGDTTVDILEGKNAGASLVISVTNGAYQADELAALEPTHLVANLEEALHVILSKT